MRHHPPSLPAPALACLLLFAVCSTSAPSSAPAELTAAPAAEPAGAPLPLPPLQREEPPLELPASAAEADGPALVQASAGSPQSLAGRLPDDIAALVGGGASSSAVADPAAEQAPEVVPPAERVSQGITLLDPPAGFMLPRLTQAQRDAAPRLRQGARQGTTVLAFQRCVASAACGAWWREGARWPPSDSQTKPPLCPPPAPLQERGQPGCGAPGLRAGVRQPTL